jgi:hypothetical protein
MLGDRRDPRLILLGLHPLAGMIRMDVVTQGASRPSNSPTRLARITPRIIGPAYEGTGGGRTRCAAIGALLWSE